MAGEAGRYDDRLDKAVRCMAPPEPDLLAATRALKPVIEDPRPAPPTDVERCVKAAAVLAGYALAGQQFLFWHARGNITFGQQYNPWERHLRQGVAYYHGEAAKRAVAVLVDCYGSDMFDRMRRGDPIRPEEYRCPGGGDAVILSCYAFAAIHGSDDHLHMLVYAAPDSRTGIDIQSFVRDNHPAASKPEYNVGSTERPEMFGVAAARQGALFALSIIGEL